ncbi:MAG: bacteriophage abortive infection AbiH family protein [Pseudobacter sp.]|uniref:bacteriophage abortive infection AbiH family protein n=1 Tax=Pseudobacter sp. TaxID=2045420 RepID=UPI003F7CE047
MNDTLLCVIGNGFDIHHGIRSDYRQFKFFVQEKDPALYRTIEQYFGPDEKWGNFEEVLAYLDAEMIAEKKVNYLNSYGADDWSDDDNYAYQREIENAIKQITVHLKSIFTQWILSVKAFPPEVAERTIPLDKTARFLTFNYTDTLERVYRIARERILHIHGIADDERSLLILGHGRPPAAIPSLNKGLLHDPDVDIRIKEGNALLDAYYEKNYKPTGAILREHAGYFESLKEIDEIHVLGHAFSVIDMPYFMAIIRQIQCDRVRWRVSFYLPEEEDKFRKVLVDLGIDNDLITLVPLKGMYNG